MANKLNFCNSVDQLYEQLGSKSIVLPEYVFEADGELSGQRDLLATSSGRHWNLAIDKLKSKVLTLTVTLTVMLS